MGGLRAVGGCIILASMRSPRIAAIILVASVLAVSAPSAAAIPLAVRWPEAEAFARQLIDCNRAGGWVTEDGACDLEDADRRVPRREPLRLHRKLTDEVARPHARRLARAGYLSHFLGGSIAERFARAGMERGRIGENIGYAGGREDVLAGVLRVHLLFQSEWDSGGWHWRNLMDRRFTRVGVGVWVRGDRTYLVQDFHS